MERAASNDLPVSTATASSPGGIDARRHRDDAVAWVRRMRADGGDWSVLPRPSVPELYPHARNTEDAPWHAVKAEIIEAIGELTLQPRMNPARRAAAIAAGITGWDDGAASAAALGVSSPSGAAQLDAVLAANRAAAPTVPPPAHRERWLAKPTPVEFFVDFETTSSLADDFTSLPAVGGQPLVFQIGCGHWQGGEWRFAQWTADSLNPDQEVRIIDAWLAHMAATVAATGHALADARIVHWSPAEPVNLETAYNSARTRHPDADWPPSLPWFDFLVEVVRREPVTVTGAFSFGLKPIAKAMHAAGFIETTWGDGPTDGLGAMIGAWWCDTEARRLGVPMTSSTSCARSRSTTGSMCASWPRWSVGSARTGRGGPVPDYERLQSVLDDIAASVEWAAGWIEYIEMEELRLGTWTSKTLQAKNVGTPPSRRRQPGSRPRAGPVVRPTLVFAPDESGPREQELDRASNALIHAVEEAAERVVLNSAKRRSGRKSRELRDSERFERQREERVLVRVFLTARGPSTAKEIAAGTGLEQLRHRPGCEVCSEARQGPALHLDAVTVARTPRAAVVTSGTSIVEWTAGSARIG